ncbi:MAG: FecR family protein, partial [Treponema sp.]|nr:FecR family protein [Treponema sp.]
LSLSEISSSAGTETINVNLQTGRVRVDVNPPSGIKAVMSVTSPMATASVRGTSFEFDTQSLTVLEGTVTFQGSNGGVMMVSAGSTSEISPNGRSIDPIETFASALLPPPPGGTDTGAISAETSAHGKFGMDFILH